MGKLNKVSTIKHWEEIGKSLKQVRKQLDQSYRLLLKTPRVLWVTKLTGIYNLLKSLEDNMVERMEVEHPDEVDPSLIKEKETYKFTDK